MAHPPPDYDDPEVAQRWLDERRAEVIAYLQGQRVEHGQVGDGPAWYLPPMVSIWAIESRQRPGWLGWWAICGDLPTDYVSADTIKHPREALRAIAERWSSAARDMAADRETPGFTVGPRAEWPRLAPMLASRAEALEGMASDPELWDED